MKKYLAFLYIEFQQGLHHRGAALGRAGFYGLILFIFSRLWKVVAVQSTISLDARSMLWYLAMTELIALSFPMTHLEIEEDVRTGNLAYALIKPSSYLWSRYARALGMTISRWVLLSLAGLFFAFIFSGGFPQHTFSFFLFIPLALFSLAIGLIFHVIIGITSFWIQESSPIYWVWQKLGFILGGMILPLDIYPHWLKTLASFTPFVSFFYEPVIASINLDFKLALFCVLKLFFWGGMGVLLAQWTYSRARKGLVVNGG